MSYSIVGLGGPVASGSQAYCGGLQYGLVGAAGNSIDKGMICGQDTWSEYTYRGLAGQQSWYHELEHRVNVAMSLITEQKLSDEAWNRGFDQDIYIDNSFIAGVTKAKSNFYKLYPVTRWKLIPLPFGDVWVSTNVQNNPDVVAVYDSLLGKKTTEQDRKDFDAKTFSVVTSVPRRTDPLNPQGLPFWQQPGLTLQELVVVDGNKLVPVPWFRSFLDLYAPGWPSLSTGTSSSSGARTISKTTASKMIASGAFRRATTVGTQKSGTTASDTGKPSMVVPIVVVGAIVVGAGVYWYKTRKK